jgi:anti-sigma factor (TIGR02949 family)
MRATPGWCASRRTRGDVTPGAPAPEKQVHMDETRTIDCEEALRRLFDYLDAELGATPRRELEQHLEQCRSCFSRLEFERRLKAHVRELGTEQVPDELRARIRKVLDTFNC